jgi:hypothetical protein
MANPSDEKMKRRSKQPERRKFYRMSQNLNAGAPGYEIVNERLLAGDRIILDPPPGCRGFRDYPEPPRLVIGGRRGHVPRDLEAYCGYWLVSDRMKTLLESIDSAGLAFVKCEVQVVKGKIDNCYWLCDVTRMLDAVDEEK